MSTHVKGNYGKFKGSHESQYDTLVIEHSYSTTEFYISKLKNKIEGRKYKTQLHITNAGTCIYRNKFD